MAWAPWPQVHSSAALASLHIATGTAASDVLWQTSQTIAIRASAERKRDISLPHGSRPSTPCQTVRSPGACDVTHLEYAYLSRRVAVAWARRWGRQRLPRPTARSV